MDLQVVLQHIGISCYWLRLIDAGFETWEMLKDITEADMNDLAIKLGHRRKLQRQIATSREVPTTFALETPFTCCCGIPAAQRLCASRVRLGDFLNFADFSNMSIISSYFIISDIYKRQNLSYQGRWLDSRSSAIGQSFSAPKGLFEAQLDSNGSQGGGLPWEVSLMPKGWSWDERFGFGVKGSGEIFTTLQDWYND